MLVAVRAAVDTTGQINDQICASGPARGRLCAATAGRQMMADAPAGGAPTVLRMILGRQLQALREKAGLSYEQAAESIFASSFTIRRMEKAEGGLRPTKVKGLLMAYGITDVREIDAFLALARAASGGQNCGDVRAPGFRVSPALKEAANLPRG